MIDHLAKLARRRSPFLTILIPTFRRAEFVRALLARLSLQVDKVQPGLVEVLVSNNVSPDHTADVLHDASRAWPWLRVVTPPNHLLSAEENLLFGLKAARGRYVWGMGDDDDVADNALTSVLQLLRKEAPDALYINVSTLSAKAELTRDRLLTLRQPQIDWPIHRIVAAIGFMGLAACISAFVIRRRIALKANWSAHLQRSAIYTHVVAYLEVLAGRRCLLVDEPLVLARQGATGLVEFQRFSDASGRHLSWPWTVGLPRHLVWLQRAGVVPPDFAARCVEPASKPVRLLPHMIRQVAGQVELWLAEGGTTLGITLDDLQGLAALAAAAPRVEREAVRELIAAGQIAASLCSAPDAIPPEQVCQIFSADERRELLDRVPDRSLSTGGPPTDREDASLRVLVERAIAGDRASRAVTSELVQRRLRNLSLMLETDTLPQSERYRGEAEGGFVIHPLGGVYAAVPEDRALTFFEAEALRIVDPLSPTPDIIVAAERAQAVESARRSTRDSPLFDEVFAGFRLGAWRGRQIASPLEDAATDLSSSITTAGGRLQLRCIVLQARRESSPPFRSRSALQRLMHASSETPPSRPARGAVTGGGQGAEADAFGELAWARLAPLLFDRDWYLRSHPFVERAVQEGAVGDPLDHWLKVGARYGLNPSPWFDSEFYMASYPQVWQAVADGAYQTPVHHYLAEGARLGYVPFEPFDPAFYLRQNRGAQQAFDAGISPLEHFLGTDPDAPPISPRFDAKRYLELNPDVARAVRDGVMPSALYHYRTHGRAEARQI